MNTATLSRATVARMRLRSDGLRVSVVSLLSSDPMGLTDPLPPMRPLARELFNLFTPSPDLYSARATTGREHLGGYNNEA